MDDFIQESVVAFRDFTSTYPMGYQFFAQTKGGCDRPNPDQVFGHMKRIEFELDGKKYRDPWTSAERITNRERYSSLKAQWPINTPIGNDASTQAVSTVSTSDGSMCSKNTPPTTKAGGPTIEMKLGKSSLSPIDKSPPLAVLFPQTHGVKDKEANSVPHQIMA